ncbi:MAG: exonuclease [Aliifodinibius sp.]|nr:YqaJ viral recombinase family protein [Fodinibius sp.]NIY26972.1 exonuclease [Fodinibius sp.]
MIIHDVEQGTPEWLALRLGIPTASEFAKIITSTGKASTSANTYMHKLLGEWCAGKPEDTYSNDDIERGNLQEEEARDYYQFIHDLEDHQIEQVGFVTTDDGLIGCSPDGLVMSNGGIEIKCPRMSGHVETILRGKPPTKYLPQIHGCMFVTERDYWDFISYHQYIEPFVIRVNRDDEYIKKMASALSDFNEKLNEAKDQLIDYKKVAA